MKLTLKQIPLGPLETNAVVIIEEDSKRVIVVDPSFEPEPLVAWTEKEGMTIEQIWITHGHADHTAGVPALLRALPEPVDVLISEEAYKMILKQGTSFFGMRLEPFPEPTRFITHGEKLGFKGSEEGEFIAEARFAPGTRQVQSCFIFQKPVWRLLGTSFLGKGLDAGTLKVAIICF